MKNWRQRNGRPTIIDQSSRGSTKWFRLDFVRLRTGQKGFRICRGKSRARTKVLWILRGLSNVDTLSDDGSRDAGKAGQYFPRERERERERQLDNRIRWLATWIQTPVVTCEPSALMLTRRGSRHKWINLPPARRTTISSAENSSWGSNNVWLLGREFNFSKRLLATMSVLLSFWLNTHVKMSNRFNGMVNWKKKKN